MLTGSRLLRGAVIAQGGSPVPPLGEGGSLQGQDKRRRAAVGESKILPYLVWQNRKNCNK